MLNILELISTNYAIFTLSYLATNSLEIQIIMLLLEVQSTLRSINNELKEMLTTNAIGNFSSLLLFIPKLLLFCFVISWNLMHRVEASALLLRKQYIW